MKKVNTNISKETDMLNCGLTAGDSHNSMGL